MRALTVRQPWAQLIALGVKTIETRSWATKYRGPLVIHAGKATPISARMGPWEVWNERGVGSWLERGRLDSIYLDFGAIVGTCNLVDVVPIVELGEEPLTRRIEVGTWAGGPNLMLCAEAVCEDCGDDCDCDASKWYERDVTDQLPYGDFTPGRFAWLLEDIQPVEKRCPVCRGWSDHVGRFYDLPPCPTCDRKGYTDPVPTRGKQRLWEWSP